MTCWWFLGCFQRRKKVVTVIQTSNASVLLCWCHWEMKISHTSTRMRWSQFPREAVSKPRQNLLPLQSTLPGNFSYSNGKGLAAPSLKCWRQHAQLKSKTKAWSFSGKQPYTNGTPGSHVKHCAVVFVPNTTGKQIFLWFFCQSWKFSVKYEKWVRFSFRVWSWLTKRVGGKIVVSYVSEASSWAAVIELIYQSKNLADIFLSLHQPENSIIHYYSWHRLHLYLVFWKKQMETCFSEYFMPLKGNYIWLNQRDCLKFLWCAS